MRGIAEVELDVPIRTRRLVLRTLTADDATDRYLGWMRDPETTHYLEARLVEHSLQSLRDYLEACNASAADLLLGICTSSGSHIGNIRVGPINRYHQHAPVGLLIGEHDQRGRGHATEAIAAATGHAFEALALEKLYAGCYAANVGSARAFLKAGWVEEGRSKAHWLSDGRREDNISLGITRSDWSALSR